MAVGAAGGAVGGFWWAGIGAVVITILLLIAFGLVW